MDIDDAGLSADNTELLANLPAGLTSPARAAGKQTVNTDERRQGRPRLPAPANLAAAPLKNSHFQGSVGNMEISVNIVGFGNCRPSL